MDLPMGELTPLRGGFSGETFVADAAGERTVVRIYAGRGAARGPESPETDAAVLELVRGLVPVPEVLEVRRPDPQAGTPGLLVTSFLPGERLEEVLPRCSDEEATDLGRAVGEVVARLAMMPTPRAGLFTDGRLTLAPMPAGMADLEEWVARSLPGTALEAWPDDDRAALVELARRGQDVSDEVTRTCLVHSDLNPQNLLVDVATRTVLGVVDWEFAHSGSPYADLGNLLRFDRDGAFARAALRAVHARVPDFAALPEETVLARAGAADLWALVDLAARAGENPVTDRAHALLHRLARTGKSSPSA